MARYGSWGAVPEVFDERRVDWHERRLELLQLLGERGFEAARFTTINAHFTDPAIAAPMWNALTSLGFDQGTVLEPGSGMGTFIGLAPEGASMTGVELDPTTAELAGHLYPQAAIRAEGFETSRFPNNSFDAAIGNVPFGDLKLYDPTHNAGEHSIHNHFILKSLDLVRPGGIAAFVTSAYTMDSQNPAARKDMHARADLLGAVRLPNNAHRRAAGTEVLTDVLLFRKRHETDAPRDDQWVRTALHDVPVLRGQSTDGTRELRINDYFWKHPEQVLGDFVATQGVRGSLQLGVQLRQREPLSETLTAALSRVTDRALSSGLGMSENAPAAPSLDLAATTDAAPAEPSPVAPAPASIRWDGHIEAAGDDFVEYIDGQPEPLEVPKAPSTRRELRSLLQLRDLGTTLLQTEARTQGDSPELTAQRNALREAWQHHQDTYGPINRFRASWRTSTKTGREYMVPIYPSATKAFRDDPFSAFVSALEKFDPETQTARPADLLEHRTVARRHTPQGAENVRDALAITLDHHGYVNLDHVAQLRGITPEEARTELGTLVFEDPTTDRLVPAAEYLSGNVRVKLRQAQEAAETDPERYGANIPALEQVIPEDLTPADIEPQIGAVWIPASDHQEFITSLLGTRPGQITLETTGDGTWLTEQRGVSAMTSANTTWGTRRRNALDLFKAMAEQRPILVHDKQEDDSTVLNPTETAAANAKADALRERFQEWVWEDPERAERLTKRYNDTFNALVLRDYTDAGAALTFPGMAETFTPRDHQRSAVARMLNEPAVGLFHQVGAGKTAEMVIGSMELKRLGMAQKPAIVVPNHMLEQFSREFMQIYPRAMILAASGDDLTKTKRRQFVGRLANNDWDCVIMTRGAFQKLDLTPEHKADFIRAELTELREAHSAASEAGSELSVKEIEKKVKRAEERLKKELDKDYDPGISFEDTGIDYLCIDEAHDYKNLETPSNIRGAAVEGSDRARDMKMKVDYLRSVHGERVATFATGTPIANSVSEAYIMQKYLRPDLLEAAGVRSFDTWAATFGKTVMSVEMAPEGNKFRTVQRFSQFQNVPELLRMMHTYADVKLADDLDLPTPELRERADGKRGPEMEMVPASAVAIEYIQELGERAEAVRKGFVAPYEDNMLKISSDGRKAALHPELVGLEDPAANTGKVARAADAIATTYHQHKTTDYETDAGGTAPGALQIVFCDMHASAISDYDAYDDLRDRLAAAGVPREKIRFMQEAKNDRDKAAIFSDARNGDIAVLIGSTQTMGTGTNVQRRAIALHHLDCPWRPADVEQREGRIIRQGNSNAEISVHRWATQKSFDAYMWQTVERKSKFINQVMRGRLDMRTIEDVGQNSLDYAEITAIAADNPLLIEKTKLTTELQRLTRLERAHDTEQQNLRIRIPQMRDTITTLRANQGTLLQLAGQTQDIAGDNFTMNVRGHDYRERSKAGEAIRQWARGTNFRPQWQNDTELGQIGTLAGHPIHATIVSLSASGQAPQNPRIHLHVPGTLDHHAVKINAADLGAVDHRIITSLEAKITAISRDAAGIQHQLPVRERELAEAEANLGKPFKHAHLLKLTRDQLAEVDKKMAAKDEQPTEQPNEPVVDVQPNPTSETTAPRSNLPHRAPQWRTTPAADSGYGR
ncbi:MAG: helicase [Gordonia sp. (in: high G+C Gram-positive bacteria)]|nr:MAG: helicase [Gordonia sp. (in: high G+C Gram-positive bacteria)]